eukprot:4466210-Ditylum_brightwellii.AAC.1
MEDEVKSVSKAAEKRVDEAQAAAWKIVFAEHRHTATVISTKEATYPFVYAGLTEQNVTLRI